MEATQSETPSKKVKISVVIPCYNQGQWLWEAIESVLAQDMDDYEIIVVNDGSTDPVTNRIVSEIEHKKILVVTTENQGLSGARNEGIRRASGEYVLPLDSDDRLHPSYLRKAAAVLDAQLEVGIVYSKAELFGEEQGLWDLEPYSFPGVLLSPQIFASSMFRKSDWEKVGGYRTDMIYGWEDYDFWLSLIGNGVQVHRLDEVLFYYRKTAGSMAGLDRKRMLYSFRKLFEHHKELYEANIGSLFEAVIASKHLRDLEKLNQSDVFEVYIPDGEGYAARDTREQNYPIGTWTEVSIFLNAIPDADIHLLRLDPSRKVCVVDIESIKLVNAATNTTLWEVGNEGHFDDLVMGPNTYRLPHERCLRLFCAGEDGHFFLPKLSREVMSQPLVLQVWMQQHGDLGALNAFCAQQATDLQSIDQMKALQKELEAHVTQSTELRAEVDRQRAHATELDKIREAAVARAEVFKSEAQQAKSLVETLNSELRQSQERSRQLESKLLEVEKQLELAQAKETGKKRGLFSGK